MSRVLLINGSPNEFGCTYTALSEVKKSLEKNGVAAEIYYLGKPAIHGCTGCDACSKLDRCMYDDAVNAVAARLDEFDGIVVGSPVHYSGPSAQVCAFMDPVLGAGSRDEPGRGAAGRGRHADDAHAGRKYGVAAALHRGR